MMTVTLHLIFFVVVLTTGNAEQYKTITPSVDLHHIPENDEKLSVGKSLIDTVIDLALEKIRAEVVEPIALQDIVEHFNKSFLFIPIRGEAALYNGLLEGVRSIKRASEAHFTIHNLHDVDVTCSFQFEKLNFTYDFQANLYNKVSTDGEMEGNMIQLMADTNMQIDLKNKTIELTSLTLKTAKSITLQLHSDDYFDKFINYVIKMITSNFKSTILSQIQAELHSILKQKFHY